jgi:endonuclease/exonuclease/phosphatase family metal-dependent hydrolase
LQRSGTSKEAPMLTVMTMNVNLYEEKHGPWPKRRRVIEDAARDAFVDVLALQAVRRHKDVEGGIDQGAQLANALSFEQRCFRPAHRRTDGSEDGVAIVSRLPLEASVAKGLSTREGTLDPWPRVMVRVEVQAPTKSVFLVNAHLSWVPEQNEDNVTELIAFLHEQPSRTILVGDFNATPDAPAIGRLRDAGFVDAWRRLRPGEAGYTFESSLPDKRIDYVLVSSDLAPRLEDIRLAATGTFDGARGSDHLGVVVNLDL